MDDIIANENLPDTFIYADNITVCGRAQEEHDMNLDKFFTVARKYNLTPYAKGIPRYSEKTHSLGHCKDFPLGAAVVKGFNELKADIGRSVELAIDNSIPLAVETGASDHAFAATLNQSGRLVASFSRTLTGSEQRHPSVEKEAYAIDFRLR